jgi:hypothetical protein
MVRHTWAGAFAARVSRLYAGKARITSIVFLADRRITYPTIFFGVVMAAPALGADMQKEINHLLQFVEHTECQYERNGKMHTGKEAVKHIKTKYNYFKNDINNAEKFIELSATKSTMSGKFYFVHCPNRPTLKSQDWLLQELNDYRNGGPD